MNSPRLVNTGAMSVAGGGGKREEGGWLDLFDPINSSTRYRSDFSDYHDRKCNTLVLIGNFRYRNSRIGDESRSPIFALSAR